MLCRQPVIILRNDPNDRCFFLDYHPLFVNNTDIHGVGVEINSAMMFVLLVVKFHTDQPFFKISYDYDYSNVETSGEPSSKAWLKIDDLTNPGNLFDGTFDLSPDATGSGVLYIPIPVGHELEVYFGISSQAPRLLTAYSTSSQLSLNYNMAVTPEPVSSMLFLAGAATLAIGYYRKKRKKSAWE